MMSSEMANKNQKKRALSGSLFYNIADPLVRFNGRTHW